MVLLVFSYLLVCSWSVWLSLKYLGKLDYLKDWLPVWYKRV